MPSLKRMVGELSTDFEPLMGMECRLLEMLLMLCELVIGQLPLLSVSKKSFSIVTEEMGL